MTGYDINADGTIAGCAPRKTLGQAAGQIIIADLSMSLDNVLAVAGAAREHPFVLVFGLTLSILLMGVAATFIARLLQKYRWIAYVGLAVILYVALGMVYRGALELHPDRHCGRRLSIDRHAVAVQPLFERLMNRPPQACRTSSTWPVLHRTPRRVSTPAVLPGRALARACLIQVLHQFQGLASLLDTPRAGNEPSRYERERGWG